MISLKTLMGGAGYFSFSSDLQVGSNWPKVLRVVPAGGGLHVIMPGQNLLKVTDARKFLIVNSGSASVTISYLANVTDPTTHIITSTRFDIGTLAAGNGATVSFQHVGNSINRTWSMATRSLGAKAFGYQTSAGGTPAVFATTSDTPPVPKDAPPPPVGAPLDLGGAASTYTVTIVGATGDCAIWNGTWTVNKSTTTPTYWRHQIDANHWLDVRSYPNNPEDYSGNNWQIVLVDMTKKCQRRLGANAPSATTAPPPGLYVCFTMPSEQATCSPAVAATLS